MCHLSDVGGPLIIPHNHILLYPSMTRPTLITSGQSFLFMCTNASAANLYALV